MSTSQTRSRPDSSNRSKGLSIRALLIWGSLAYTVFAIYGSLVPLEFHALPLEEALARFRQIRFLNLGVGSRADWVANLLLFVPLTFLWTGALSHERNTPIRLLISLFVVICAALLSLCIEFTQLYFPQRTVSQNDILAEMFGGVIGVGAWGIAGKRFAYWLEGWKSVKSHLAITQRLTLLYLFLLFGYSLLPLDLTISPVEVYHKYREGKFNLLPFARLPHNPVHALYELVSDSLLWFVPALMWRWSDKTSSVRVWALMTGAALLLEVLQVFVYSRVSDITDIFTAAMGAAMGVWLVNLLGKNTSHNKRAGDIGFVVLPAILATSWVLVILIAFWYPFDFRTDGAFLRDRLHRFLASVPFQAYYFGSEFRAATEVMHKVLFFIPLGIMLGWGVSRMRYMWRAYAGWFSQMIMMAVALLVLAGRLAQPEKSPDLMDPVLNWLGGASGFALVRLVMKRRLSVALPVKHHLAANSHHPLQPGDEGGHQGKSKAIAP